MRNHPIIVQKYGGVCLETPAKIRAVARSLADLHGRGHRVVAIVSAMVEATSRNDYFWSILTAFNLIAMSIILILLNMPVLRLVLGRTLGAASGARYEGHHNSAVFPGYERSSGLAIFR